MRLLIHPQPALGSKRKLSSSTLKEPVALLGIWESFIVLLSSTILAGSILEALRAGIQVATDTKTSAIDVAQR